MAAPSMIAGTADNSSIRKPTRLSVSLLTSNPALSRMTISAIRRRSDDAVNKSGLTQFSM